MYLLLPLAKGPERLQGQRPLGLLRLDAGDAWQAVEAGALFERGLRERRPGQSPAPPRLVGRWVLWPRRGSEEYESWMPAAERRLWGKSPQALMVMPAALPHLRDLGGEAGHSFRSPTYALSGFSPQGVALRSTPLTLSELHRVCVLESPVELHPAILRRLLPLWPEAALDWARGFPAPVGYPEAPPRFPGFGPEDLLALSQSEVPAFRLLALQALPYARKESLSPSRSRR